DAVAPAARPPAVARSDRAWTLAGRALAFERTRTFEAASLGFPGRSKGGSRLPTLALDLGVAAIAAAGEASALVPFGTVGPLVAVPAHRVLFLVRSPHAPRVLHVSYRNGRNFLVSSRSRRQGFLRCARTGARLDREWHASWSARRRLTEPRRNQS